jgi:tight adherence protein C
MPVTVVLAAAALAGSIVLLVWSLTRSRPARVTGGQSGSSPAATVDLRTEVLRHSAHQRARPAMSGLVATVRRCTPKGVVDNLDRSLTLCGRPAGWSIGRVLVGKLMLGVTALLWGLLLFADELTVTTLATVGVMTALGYFAPDLMLKSRGAERQKLIDRELPNVLDQVTIAVEAGLGFEAALARTAHAGAGPLSSELTRTLQEIQFGVARGQAMRNMAARVDSPDLRHFVTAIVQAESYGISVADILRTQAAEQRMKRRQRAEEHAMKVPVKMVLPLIVCILPALFVVILGPAVVQISRTMFSNGGL